MTKSKPAKTAPHPDFPLPYPGASIADAIEGSGDTKIKAATKPGITRRALYDLFDGKTPITAPMALRLERVFGGSTEFWLGLQVQYNLWRAGRDLKAA
jgi:addiction module HigA family antidote